MSNENANSLLAGCQNPSGCPALVPNRRLLALCNPGTLEHDLPGRPATAGCTSGGLHAMHGAAAAAAVQTVAGRRAGCTRLQLAALAPLRSSPSAPPLKRPLGARTQADAGRTRQPSRPAWPGTRPAPNSAALQLLLKTRCHRGWPRSPAAGDGWRRRPPLSPQWCSPSRASLQQHK